MNSLNLAKILVSKKAKPETFSQNRETGLGEKVAAGGELICLPHFHFYYIVPK